MVLTRPPDSPGQRPGLHRDRAGNTPSRDGCPNQGKHDATTATVGSDEHAGDEPNSLIPTGATIGEKPGTARPESAIPLPRPTGAPAHRLTRINSQHPH